MPPPRRRPVQPATRVRLPRSARSGSAPAAHVDAGPAESQELLAGQVQTEEARPGDVVAGQADETVTVTEPAETEPAEAAADGGWLEDADDPDGFDGADGPAGPGAVTDVAEPAEKTPQAAADERHPMLWPACLGALAVTLGSLAIWFGVAASSTGNGVDEQNTALTDAAATAQVNQQIDKEFSTIFSYNYADTAKTLQAARTVLTGKAVGEYASLFKVVEQDAPKEKLVLTTTVTNSGVERLAGRTARVLIFANQRDTSASRQITDSGAMLAINAVQVNGQWKIASIDAFSSG
jgi:Mce-associated membrane protein